MLIPTIGILCVQEGVSVVENVDSDLLAFVSR